MERIRGPPGRENKFYFPFPDPIVHMAYPLEQTTGDLKTMTDELYPKFLSLVGKRIVGELTEGKKFLIFYPRSDSESRDIYRRIGLLQYLQQTRPDVKEQLESSIFSRVYLGSPHMFYRWQSIRPPGSKVRLELTTDPPIYPQIYPQTYGDTRWHLVPLNDEFDTMLLWTDQVIDNPTVTKLRQALPIYDPLSGGIYCGDFQEDWQRAYTKGKAGSFTKCYNLYSSQSLPLTSSSTVRSLVPTPVIPLRGEIPEISEISRMARTAEEDKKEIKSLRSSVRSLKDLQEEFPTELHFLNLETEAIKRRQATIREQIEKARKEYVDAERELIQLQTIPFLRPKR